MLTAITAYALMAVAVGALVDSAVMWAEGEHDWPIVALAGAVWPVTLFLVVFGRDG